MGRFITVCAILSLLTLYGLYGASAWGEGQVGGNPLWCPPPSKIFSKPTPEPVRKTIHVDVAVPCTAATYTHARSSQFNPYCSPWCLPPSPTRPVEVKIDVRVRAEDKKPCIPQRICYETPPRFEPIFYHAARMVQAIVAVPLGLGEQLFGHPTPSLRSLPPPMPVASPVKPSFRQAKWPAFGNTLSEISCFPHEQPMPRRD